MGVVEVRVELEVSLILAAVAATLFGAVVPEGPAGLDVLNDPSARPNPGGLTELGGRRECCKGRAEIFCQIGEDVRHVREQWQSQGLSCVSIAQTGTR